MTAALDDFAQRSQEGHRDALEELVGGLQAQTSRLALRNARRARTCVRRHPRRSSA